MKRKIATPSEGEATLALHLKVEGIAFVREYHFHPTRQWRFDFAFPEHMLAVEVDGNIWNQGRHTRGKGWEQDAEKLSEAAILGWYVMRFSTGQVKRLYALGQINAFIEKRRIAAYHGTKEIIE